MGGIGRVISEVAVNPQSRATLAALRPEGVRTFPAGTQSVLEDLVRNAPGSMALFDEDLQYLEVSDEYCVQLRLSRIAVLGESFPQLLSALPSGFEDALRRAAAGDSVALEECPAPTLEQESTRRIWKLCPWRKTRKRVGGVVLFLHEITAAMPLDEQRHSMLSKLAHDFNNILLVIFGYSSLLIEDLESEPGLVTKVASIYHAAERAAKLSDELLALSHKRT